MTGSITLGRVIITSSGYDPASPMRNLASDPVLPPTAEQGSALMMKCADHISRDERLPYLAWHEKSERSQAEGLKQTRCGECKGWQWPWEMVGAAPAGARVATQAERDAAVLEAVRRWRERGQVGIPTPKGLAILAHVLFPGPALKSLDGRAVSASLARLKAQGKVHNGPGTLGWEACAPEERR